MGNSDTPVKMPELNLIPETERGIELDAGMKQVLAVLTAYCREERVVLKASPSGVLFTASSPLGDIFHVPASTGNFAYQGKNIACSEVLVMAYPTNASKIWVRTKTIATVDNAWPLDAYDVFSFTITNLNMLHILIVGNGEKAIIAYSI